MCTKFSEGSKDVEERVVIPIIPRPKSKTLIDLLSVPASKLRWIKKCDRRAISGLVTAFIDIMGLPREETEAMLRDGLMEADYVSSAVRRRLRVALYMASVVSGQISVHTSLGL